MTHAKNRALREELYRANITRASSGEINNAPIIDQVWVRTHSLKGEGGWVALHGRGWRGIC